MTKITQEEMETLFDERDRLAHELLPADLHVKQHKVFMIHKYDPHSTDKDDWGSYTMLVMPTAMEPDFYRQTRMFNTFFHGQTTKGKRLWKKHFEKTRPMTQQEMIESQIAYDGKYSYHRKGWNELILERLSLSKYMSIDVLPPYERVDGIREFFNTIGYEYKTRTWNRP